jgi:hypothetical protein
MPYLLGSHHPLPPLVLRLWIAFGLDHIEADDELNLWSIGPRNVIVLLGFLLGTVLVAVPQTELPSGAARHISSRVFWMLELAS